MNFKNINKSIFVVMIALFASCEDPYKAEPNDPIQYTSEQIKPNNLLVKVSFEDAITDSKGNLTNGTKVNGTYVTGLKGKAYQGANDAHVVFNNVSDKIKNLKSVTVCMWIKTAPHTSGAQSLFSIPKSETAAFWGNVNLLIESNTTNDLMPFKTYFQKKLTNGNIIEQWAEHVNANAVYNAYTNWTHIAVTYNGTESKYYLYVNGQNVTPAAMVDRKYVVAGTDTPFGFFAFSNVEKIVLGGFQQHLGTPWNAPESWMKNFTGAIDEFRMYDDALTATDVFRIYSFEKQGL